MTDLDFAAIRRRADAEPLPDECDLLRTAREQAMGVLRSCVAPAGSRASTGVYQHGHWVLD